MADEDDEDKQKDEDAKEANDEDVDTKKTQPQKRVEKTIRLSNNGPFATAVAAAKEEELKGLGVNSRSRKSEFKGSSCRLHADFNASKLSHIANSQVIFTILCFLSPGCPPPVPARGPPPGRPDALLRVRGPRPARPKLRQRDERGGEAAYTGEAQEAAGGTN